MHVNSCSHLFFAQYIFSHQFEIISLGAFEHGCKILARNWARFPKKPILGRLTNSFQNIFAQYKKKNVKDVNYIPPTILDKIVDCLCAWVSDFGQKMDQIRTKSGKSGILTINFHKNLLSMKNIKLKI